MTGISQPDLRSIVHWKALSGWDRACGPGWGRRGVAQQRGGDNELCGPPPIPGLKPGEGAVSASPQHRPGHRASVRIDLEGLNRLAAVLDELAKSTPLRVGAFQKLVHHAETSHQRLHESDRTLGAILDRVDEFLIGCSE